MMGTGLGHDGDRAGPTLSLDAKGWGNLMTPGGTTEMSRKALSRHCPALLSPVLTSCGCWGSRQDWGSWGVRSWRCRGSAPGSKVQGQASVLKVQGFSPRVEAPMDADVCQEKKCRWRCAVQGMQGRPWRNDVCITVQRSDVGARRVLWGEVACCGGTWRRQP